MGRPKIVLEESRNRLLVLLSDTNNENVHRENSWHFIDELVKENIMFDMMFYPMRKHGIADDPAKIHLYNKMLEFWQKYLYQIRHSSAYFNN